MAELVYSLIASAGVDRRQIVGVGVGAPGPMSHEQGLIYRAPNLPGWVNIPLRNLFSGQIGLPVVVENDANAAAFGEFKAGAGRRAHSMVLLTLGTGIGGGLVLNGKLWRGRFDNAGEIGHLIVQVDGRACPCGQRGCLERYASANAVAELLVEAVRAGKPSILADRIRANEALDARDVLDALQQGDALARDTWEHSTRHLAIGIASVQHVLNAQRYILGGGLAKAGAPLLDAVKRHLEQTYWKIAPDCPEVVLAELGSDAGAIGAAMLAREGAPASAAVGSEARGRSS
jgi:glucokinase